MDRRSWLQAAGAIAATFSIVRPSRILANHSFAIDPFQLGIASGDPTADGFVLWTRLAPRPLDGGGMPQESVAVGYEISEDENFQKIVKRGEVQAHHDSAHSVHVEVNGLEANRPYWYRFHAGDAISPTGRTRTMPGLGQTTERFRFAFASCQHYEQGYYHAYKDMLDQQLDLIIHLGDYIYEGAGTTKNVRAVPGGETITLEDYRTRHAVYKTDSMLQAAHQLHPWVVTWDDHEFDNNCAADISEESHVDPVEFLKRRASAYKAYYEHMPLRAKQVPVGPNLQLYREIAVGDLISFQVLDTRQYRSDQPCGDGNKPPCEAVFNPKATLLGDAQENWLRYNLKRSNSHWNVLAQQIMMGCVDRDPTDAEAWSMDQWSGYDAPRRRLMNFLDEANIRNPVVLTGDIHSNWVNELRADPKDLKTAPVAAEFVGTSISSGGQGIDQRNDAPGVLRDNPFVKFYNGERGYVACEVTKNEWMSDYRVVERVLEPESTVFTRAKFRVESGSSEIEKI